jgi:hypothetical protein
MIKLILLLLILTLSSVTSTAFAESDITITTDSDSYGYGEIVKISGNTPAETVTLQIKDPSGKTVLIRNIDAGQGFSFNFNLSSNLVLGNYDIVASVVIDGIPKISSTSIALLADKESSSDTPIQETTQAQQDTQTKDDTVDSEGGGCLIATAAFGSEMAPQVQFLRELRDNTVLQTQAGTTFMTGFNSFYYSFSPAVADYERENPMFKEAVKVALTPLLTSLAILNYVDIDTEQEMLGYGIGVILLNIGMYFVAPAIMIMKIRKRIQLASF